MKPSSLIRWMICGLLILGGVTVMAVGTALAGDHSPAAPQGNGGATAQSLSVGNSHACAVMSNGWLLCWGSQGASTPVLGDGTTTQRLMPVDVVSITAGASRVSAGGAVTCAVVSGAVKCWGGNANGQLGTGNTTASNVPTNVVGLTSGATDVSAGNNHACAIVNGAAKCWGTNTSGQLGTGNFTASNVPSDVVGFASGATAISARVSHTCGIVNGAAKCWGLNTSGQLGTGNSGTSTVPTQVVGLLSNVTSIGAGGSHSCAVVDGAAQCWGSNASGQLGTGNLANSNVPTEVLGLASGVTAIAASANHSCALVNGGVKCWGDNSAGQLGTGNTTASEVPTDVVGLTSGVVSIATGGSNASSSATCALLSSGALKCWGMGVSLGVGYSAVNDTSPREVLGVPEYCIFTGAINDDWANARNWSNCGGLTPQSGDSAVIGRPSTSGVVPQIYATTTVAVNRLRVVGSFNVFGQVTAGHVFGDNIANLNPNPNQNNYRFFVISPANLTVTQQLTWSVGYLDGTGNLIIQPGAVGNVQGGSPITASEVSARVRNYGTFTMGAADMGTQWTNEASGVMNFIGDVYCCSTSGGTFTNRGIINATGVNRLQPIYQYSGSLNVTGTLTRTTNFIGVTLYGGSLNGTGILSDAVDNIGGIVAPGGPNTAGSLSIGDFYRQSPTATLSIDVGGATPGAFDQLNVASTGEQPFYPGRTDLSGTLQINALNNYFPQSGDEMRFMNFNQRNGWFGAVNNAFGSALTPGAYTSYASLMGEASVGLYAKANPYAPAPGGTGGYVLLFENPFSQTVTLQAITHTLPVSVTYKPNSATGGVNPAITTVNGQQQLVWALSSSIPATGLATFSFGVDVEAAAPNGMYTSTISARTSASPQDLTLNNTAAMLVQAPFLDNVGFETAGTVVQRAGKPPAINLRRGVKNDPFLVSIAIGCPADKICNDPLTDILSVTLNIAAHEYTMTAGLPGPSPFGPAPSTAFHSAQDASAPTRPGWADPPPYHHWTPGVPCDQQLPASQCDPGPDNPHRTDDCPIPIVITVHWADNSTTQELIGCGSLYDPSGFVRDAFTSQPISNATVSLYRVPFALPDTSTQTRQCRTVDTRPGGAGGTWDSLPAANIASGMLEDESLSPARIDPPTNPQLTDSVGHYGWDVATGCWFVVVSAPGYVTKTSAVVGVPPAVTDLDILLIPESANKLYLPLVLR